MSAQAALDRFFDVYYRRHPVTATFTGVHDFDGALPDWSPEGLDAAAREMRALRSDLVAAGRVTDEDVTEFPDQVDLALADGYLEIQLAEHASGHFYQRNPSLWTGEAIFSVIALVTRPFASIGVRLQSAAARLRGVDGFLASARRTLESSPSDWQTRALRECDAAEILFARGLPAWLRACGADARTIDEAVDATAAARDAFRSFRRWLADELPISEAGASAGTDLLTLLVRRGHWCATPMSTLAAEAASALDGAHDALDDHVRALGATNWAQVEQRLTAARPSASDYLERFARVWQRFREAADAHHVVTWPDAPIRYVPIPEHTREAAPLLYYLFYRSPAPLDPPGVHDYVVAPIDGLPPEEVGRRLAVWNDSAIALNHVVHHGGLGHHVQNWYAYRSRSRIGRVAAVDAASRIAMFSGGSVAEGWACYACDLMDEVGGLTALEQAAAAHTRVRLAARAVVDLALHSGQMTLTDAAAFFERRGLMPPATARAEAIKASMFPGTPLMYWLGTREIHALRRRLRVAEPGGPPLRAFHDRFLSYGAIPVPLIARLMTGEM
jgi:hypothetical protein